MEASTGDAEGVDAVHAARQIGTASPYGLRRAGTAKPRLPVVRAASGRVRRAIRVRALVVRPRRLSSRGSARQRGT